MFHSPKVGSASLLLLLSVAASAGKPTLAADVQHGRQTSSTQSPRVSPSADGVIEGKVCNTSGDPLSDVSVRIEEDSTGAPLTFHSDSSGVFRISGLSGGSYHLVFQRDGFRPLKLSAVLLKPGEKKNLDAVLEKDSGSNVALASPVEFSDSPNFTVAGITDRSNMGLHGSDANVRTSDALAKETAALKSHAEESPASGAGNERRLAGDAKEKSGDALGAVKEYEAAVKIDPSEQNYFSWGAELLLHRAGEAAVQVFSRGAKAHPDSARMLAGLGAAYYSNGQYPEAAVQLCRASDVNPADPAPYLFLGRMEQAAADPFFCSEAALARFAKSQPGDPQAKFLYGVVLWKEARKTQNGAQFAHAEVLFREAIKLDPKFSAAYLQLGLLHSARGEKAQALSSFKKATLADPRSSAAHYQLSLAYRRSGEAAKADMEMKAYDELRRSEDAEREKEHRELRQFVITLQDGRPAQP